MSCETLKPGEQYWAMVLDPDTDEWTGIEKLTVVSADEESRARGEWFLYPQIITKELTFSLAMCNFYDTEAEAAAHFAVVAIKSLRKDVKQLKLEVEALKKGRRL